MSAKELLQGYNGYFNGEYLTEKSCQKLQEILRKNYYARLEKISMRNYQPKVIQPSKSVVLPPIHKHTRKLSNQLKQIIFSSKVRKSVIGKPKPRKNTFDSTSSLNLKKELSSKETQEFEEMRENLEKRSRKARLPFLEKKVPRDPHEIKYETRYIDEVEEKYIQPYLDKKNIVYVEYVKSRRSKVPLNFMIS